MIGEVAKWIEIQAGALETTITTVGNNQAVGYIFFRTCNAFTYVDTLATCTL
jgi:hypothetical protein